MALYLAMRDPRTPMAARLLAMLVVGYALSPIDLIPDFVPLLGYIDDLILLPLGIWLVLRLMPEEVMADARRRAGETEIDPAIKRIATAIIIALWILVVVLVIDSLV